MDKKQVVAQCVERISEERENLSKEFFPELPEDVLEVLNCEVAFNFSDKALPYRNISFTDLSAVLGEVYGLKFVMPDNVGPIIQHFKDQSLDKDKIGAILLDQDNVEIRFRDGLLRLADGRAVSFPRVSLSSQSINVNVLGSTKVGEHIITELSQLAWSLAGVRKDWREIATKVEVVQYGSATRVKFPDAALRFLSIPFRSLLQTWSTEGGLAPRMGGRSGVHDFQPPPNSSSTFYLDELHIRFDRIVRGGFGADNTRLRIGVQSAPDRGTGRMVVTSELPLTEHLELVKDVIKMAPNQAL